jgi:hypothetical protein
VRRVVILFFLLLFSSAQAQTQSLSLEEVRQFQNRVRSNWTPPTGSQAIEMRIRLRADGTLDSPPEILTRGTGPLFIAARDAAARAVLRSAPFDMFKTGNYSEWRDIQIILDPKY